MPVGPIGLADNLFFPALLHPTFDFNAASPLLSTELISNLGVLLTVARPCVYGVAKSRPDRHQV